MTNRPRYTRHDVEPLDRDGFSFFGFGDALPEAERPLATVGLRSGEPRATVVEDAMFVPSEFLRAQGEYQAYGGIVGDDGRPVDAAELRRKGRTPQRTQGIEPIERAEQEISEPVVYLGPLFNHYGRLLLESLARVWFLTDADSAIRVVFDYPNTARRIRVPWVRRILEAFGIADERILDLAVPTRLRHVTIPEPLFEQMHLAHPAMVEPFRAVATQSATDAGRSEQPVYLSRRLLSSRQRAIIGEDELEDVLRENGFLVAHPETMSFVDQVRLFNRHKHIFSTIGSAAHSILFSLSRPTLHLLTMPDRTSANYFLCSALVGAPTTFVNCLSTGHRGSFRMEHDDTASGRLRRGGRLVGSGPQATPQYVEMPKIAAYLDDRGMLAQRQRLSLAGRNPALGERYEEAWLFGRVRKAAAKAGLGLPAEVEADAIRLAASSWPVSAILARYFAWSRHDPKMAHRMTRQFIDLVAREADMNRLAHYRSEMLGIVARVASACDPATAADLANVVIERFGVDAPDLEDVEGTEEPSDRRQKARQGQGRGRLRRLATPDTLE